MILRARKGQAISRLDGLWGIKGGGNRSCATVGCSSCSLLGGHRHSGPASSSLLLSWQQRKQFPPTAMCHKLRVETYHLKKTGFVRMTYYCGRSPSHSCHGDPKMYSFYIVDVHVFVNNVINVECFAFDSQQCVLSTVPLHTSLPPKWNILKFSRHVSGISVRFSKTWIFLREFFESPNTILHVNLFSRSSTDTCGQTDAHTGWS